MTRIHPQNIIKRYSRLSLRTKLSINFTLILLTFSFSIFFFFYDNSSNFLREKNRAHFISITNQTASSLSNLFSGVESGSRILSANDSLRHILRREPEGYNLSEQLKDYNTLSKLLSENSFDENVLSVELYCGNEAIYTREEVNLFDIDTITETDWYQKALLLKGVPLWYAEGDQLFCTRVIMDYYADDTVIGVLKINLRSTSIREILDTVLSYSMGETALVDLTGAPVYSMGQKAELIPRYLQQVQEEGLGQAVFSDRENARQVLTADLKNGWKLLATVSEEIFYPGQMNLLLSMVGITLLAIFSAVILTNLSIRRQTRRIAQIAEFMGTVHIGSEQYMAVTDKDEITTLQRGFNQMLQTARKSIQEAEVAIKLKNEAEYNILQEQINPHFLYNCLDSINWLAVEKGAQEISQMACLLGRFYRLSLGGGEKEVPLSSEVEHTAVYLQIMQLRFDGQIKISWQIEPGTEELLVPKLLLQPIIENAIQHGISGRPEQNGSIRVRTYQKDGELFLEITDAGIGISKSRLQALQDSLEIPEGKAGFGMRNVHSRLRLYFGEPYGITLRSIYHAGTRVTLRLPVQSLEKQS